MAGYRSALLRRMRSMPASGRGACGWCGAIGDAPSDSETEKGVPFVGMTGKEFEAWMAYIGVDTQKHAFITNITQCMPPKTPINGRLQVRDPAKDEINACFGPRCLRVLRAMPNLEVVIVL